MLATLPAFFHLTANRVWRSYFGGQQLDQLEGKDKPEDSQFPEDWIASTTRATNPGRDHLPDEGLSQVTLHGEACSLKQVMEAHPNEMLGADHVEAYGTVTQYLVKFLDSSVRLQFQAHPTREFSRQHLNSNSGKTEAYIILSVREEIADPYIYVGFQRPVDQADFKRAVLEQDIEAMVAPCDRIPVKPGDVFLVPSGYPHAIGEGIMMIEVMEPTDFVVRLEFERNGYVLPFEARYMNRDIDFAMSMINFEPLSAKHVMKHSFCHPRLVRGHGQNEELVLVDDRQTPCFSVKRLKVVTDFRYYLSTFAIVIVTGGSGSVVAHQADGQRQSSDLRFGDRFFVPFQTDELAFVCDEACAELEIIVALPPKPVTED